MKRLSIILGALFLCTSLMATNKITGKIIDENNNQNTTDRHPHVLDHGR